MTPPAGTSSVPPQTPAAKQSTPSLSATDLNTQTRAALINIECTTLAGGAFNPISGSGIVIDSRGVILTNAHVGQFFLLRDYVRPDNIDCVIRTGSPAQTEFHAALLYLPPAWIDKNASQIVSQEPTGNGENDFALLYITGTTDGAPLPASFPHLAMSTAAPDVGGPMLLAAYPAGFLSGQLIATNLYASSAFAYVTQLLSFSNSTTKVDLFSIGGSIESQAGSSGGAAVRGDGTLAGIIATATLANDTGARDLRAITIDYINRELQSFGKGGFVPFLTGDLSAKAAAFAAGDGASETAALEAVLNKN